MLDTLKSLLALAAIAVAAWGIGRPCRRWLGMANSDRFADSVWEFALGMVVAGIGLTVWGLIGGFDARAIRWLTVAAAGYGCLQLWGDRPGGPSSSTSGWRPSSHRFTRWQLAIAALCIPAIGGSLVSALAPAVAGDALCYHLELPKLFLSHGRIEFLPLHENSTFPLLAETWYLWALALDSAVAAQLIHCLLGLLLAAAAVLLARPLIGHGWAWLAGVVVLTVPGVTNQMTAPLNDVAVAAFATLALVAWQNAPLLVEKPQQKRAFHESPLTPALSPEGRGSSEIRLYIVAGLMAGAALSIKYVAIMFAAAAAAVWCGGLLRGNAARELRSVRGILAAARGPVICLLVAILVCGIWYARAAYHRGNPVYPFFSSLVGADGPPTVRESKTPLRWSAFDVGAAPWQVTMSPERFGGRGHQLGGLFLMLLPACLFLRRRGLGPLLTLAAVYAVLWYSLRQNVRFLLPIVPILAVAAAAVLAELRSWPTGPRVLAISSCAAVMALGAVIPLHRARQHVAVAIGLETREEFLLRHEPTYRAACFANAHLPHHAKILSQEHRAYYFDRALTRENAFRRATNYAAQSAVVDSMVSKLHAAGFTHLLTAAADGLGARYNDTLSRLVAAAEDSQPGSLRTLLDYEFFEPDGTTRRYRLIELNSDGASKKGVDAIAQNMRRQQSASDQAANRYRANLADSGRVDASNARE